MVFRLAAGAFTNDDHDTLLRNAAFDLDEVFSLLAALVHAAVKIVPGLALLNFTVNVSPLLSVRAAP